MSSVTPTAEPGENITLNVTEFSDEYLFYFTVLMQVIYIITLVSCLCGLVGNMKVIWFLGFSVQRNPFATYILNLAVVDFVNLLSGLASNINMALQYFNDAFLGGLDVIFSLVDVLDFFTYSASLYLLTAISLETVHSELFPVWYRCHRPGRSSSVVSFLLWILSGLLSGILLLCHLQGAYCKMIVNIICIVNFLICTPLLIASSLTVAITVCCKSRRRQSPRLYVAILITILIFVIVGIPLSVLHLLFFSVDDFPSEARDSCYLLASFISGINPFVYYFVGRDGKNQPKESLKVVLHKLFKEEADAREKLRRDNRQRRVRRR